MTVKNIKTELYKLIDDIEDKNLLTLIKEELITYTSAVDILDSLSATQLKELQLSVDESEKKAVISLKGYKKLTERWRIK